MAFSVFNTLSRSIETFTPLDSEGKKVGLYCCGPTIYDFAHIGNFRTFLFVDLLRRALEFRGFKVNHVMNITDVEDKIIRRVRESGVGLRDYTEPYENAFFADLNMLSCLRPHLTPRATDHIAAIIRLIERLITVGVAYVAPDRSIYFSIEKYRAAGHRYGQLVHLDFEQMRPGERVASDEYAKESIADFALWKARVPDDGTVFWESPWGQGRPGWHIECSAMSMESLSPSFDLHVGGEDLAFPHHEDEIAQSEGSGLQQHGHRFVKYWMHCAHLLVEGKKMAKSLGNFFTLRDLLQKGYSGREIRYVLIKAHYRATFNFTFGDLDGARATLARIDECRTKLQELAAGQTAPAAPEILDQFATEIENDLNISKALAVLFESLNETNRRLVSGGLDPKGAGAILAAWDQIDSVLGVLNNSPAQEIPAELTQLLDERLAARKSRDFKRADAIRNELRARGWVIEDTPKGARLKKA